MRNWDGRSRSEITKVSVYGDFVSIRSLYGIFLDPRKRCTASDLKFGWVCYYMSPMFQLTVNFVLATEQAEIGLLVSIWMGRFMAASKNIGSFSAGD
jgi:hypothetical protein